MKLQGRVCVVTGAGRGIGKGIARRLLEEGGRVWICDVRPERVDQALADLSPSGEARGSATDVSQRDQVEAMFALVLSQWSRVDVLVNNAGIARNKPFVELTDAEWDNTLNVNLRGTFLCSQVAVRQMVQQGGGAIVNIASTNGLRGQPRLVDYGASKAGIINLTLSLAVELAEYGIRVNAICPGTIWTELNIESGWSEERWAQFREQIPLHRFGAPADIAAAVAYLVSDDAGFITGHMLVVDGGLMAPQFHVRL